MIRLTPQGLLFRGKTYPCTVGRGGLTRDKREGDGATPIGLHRIVGLYHRPDRIANAPRWSMPIGPRDLWCDESGHPAYNHPVRAPFDASHEAMRRADAVIAEANVAPGTRFQPLDDVAGADAAEGGFTGFCRHRQRQAAAVDAAFIRAAS